MKYVVLGSSGFIGRRLCEILIERGEEVRLIPRDMYGNEFALEKYLSAEKPDYIINCASYGNHSSQTDVNAIYEANLINPLHLLEATKNIPYEELILIGSSSEYGLNTRPMSEKDLPKTDTFYGASKVAQTYLSRAHAKTYNKKITVVRPFSVYGPGEAEFRFIPTVIRSLKEAKRFPLVCHPTHDWIYIDDFIEGLVAICETPKSVSHWVVSNLGTGTCWTNREIVRLLEAISGDKALFDEVDSLREYDSNLWVADVVQTERIYKFRAKTSILEGLRKTYEYYQ